MKQASLRSIFSRGKKRNGDDGGQSVGNPIPQLSPVANSVVARCCRHLCLSTDGLQQKFASDLPDLVKKPETYARNLIEYCSYHTVHVLTKRADYLADKDFRRLTFDMMIAWEDPGAQCEDIYTAKSSGSSPKFENEDDGSIFSANSTSMAVQVDSNKSIGPEAFARIAPACPAIADSITVHNLFDALTCSSNGQLHFLIYDKYLGALDKVLKSVKSVTGQNLTSGIQLAKGELILDIDGVMPTQPVLQHTGISAWPGRLTLTNCALYFESLGVGYDKPVAYELATELKQVIRPDLTGPLGTRLFDKAVMYKSTSMEEPVYFEFPEFKGQSRRNYWLAIIREVTYVSRFTRKFNRQPIQQAEAFSKSILAILRYRACREAFHVTPSHYKILLPFNLAEELPKGDEILEALYNHLQLLQISSGSPSHHEESFATQPSRGLLPVSLLALTRLGFSLCEESVIVEDRDLQVGDFFIGDISPLEMSVKQSVCDSGPAEAARATVEQVRVEGLDTNVAVMKELLFPMVEAHKRLCFLAAWEDPFKSTAFLVLTFYFVYKGWVKYLMPTAFIFLAIFMFWNKHKSKGKPLEAFKVKLTQVRNPVEQLIALQEGISQLETLSQEGNIILLKLRAILFAARPQVTGKVAVMLVAAAFFSALVPLKYWLLLAFLDVYTREMPLRKATGEKLLRRIREWWIHIPAAPVELVRPEDSKKRK